MAVYRGPLIGGPKGQGQERWWPDPYLVLVLKDGTCTEYEHIASDDQPHATRHVYGWWVAVPKPEGDG